MAIKRIIFDLDNTLIPWEDEYLNGIKSVCKKFNLDYDYHAINDVIDTSFENEYLCYSIENFQTYIKNQLNLELSKEFITSWLDSVGNMSKENPEANEILAYLKPKYDLVVLTNWFAEGQEKRMEHARMRHFFTKVYGGDTFVKPSKEAFKAAIGDYKPEECLMVGDSYEIDYKGAIDAGLNAILLSNKEPLPNVNTIKSLKELKNIL